MAVTISVKSFQEYPTALLLSVKDHNPDLMLASVVATHKCVLSSLSPLLSSLLTTVDSTDTITLVLPQVELIIIEKMVQLVYTGRCLIAQTELFKLNNLLNCLGMSTVVDNLSLCTEMMEEANDAEQSSEDVINLTCQFCGKIFIDEVPTSYHEHEKKCSEKSVEIVPPPLFNDKAVRIKSKQTSGQEQVVPRRRLRHGQCKKNVDDIGSNDTHCDPTNEFLILEEVCQDEDPVVSIEKKLHPSALRDASRRKVSSPDPAENESSSCSLCSYPLSGKSRFKTAHHLFSAHYKKKILNFLVDNQTECSVCGKICSSKLSLGRHLGETHEIATKLYEEDFGSKPKRRTVRFAPAVQNKDIIGQAEEVDTGMIDQRNSESEVKKVSWKRIRSSRYSLPCYEKQGSNSKVSVEVINEASVIVDLSCLSITTTASMPPSSSTLASEISDWLPSQITTRYLVHGRNSMPWKVDEEDYSECVMDWIKDGRVKELNDFEDLTIGEKGFFCLWDKFLLGGGYVGYVGRNQMPLLLDRFVEEMGRRVKEENLYRQFVLHLLQVEREAMLSKGQVMRLVTKIQQI